jgi:hypothetical protein
MSSTLRREQEATMSAKEEEEEEEAEVVVVEEEEEEEEGKSEWRHAVIRWHKLQTKESVNIVHKIVCAVVEMERPISL